MEALRALDDAEAIAREVRSLQEQWKKVADVPRPQADTLWRRFKTAHDEVWAKCETHFAAEAQARAENLAKKIVLCEKAEALAESSSWIQTAEEFKRLQAEWKAIGPVSRGREKAIWDRFRTACDRFFTRRHDDLATRKKMWGENLAKKDALCVRAEALAESSDWEPAAAEIRRLQNEWKTVGPVKKSRSDAVWQRFRAACDKFFTRYAQRHDIARAERVAAREAICDEMTALAPPESDVVEPPSDVVAKVRTLRGRWQQEIAARGVDPERAQALDRRFADAFAAVLVRWPSAFAGTDLDPDANRKRMEALVRRVEDLATSIAGPASAQAENDETVSPTVRLAAMLKEALAANTIGGRVDEDSRARAAAEELRQAQASWSRIGPVPEDVKRALADRFQKAGRRINDRIAARTGKAGGSGRPGR
jgi:predicted nucleic acid-binding protein